MAAIVAALEDNIRTTALTKRIRPSEFFLDYDRLRCGYVTETQFFRVLWENLGLKFNDEQQSRLSDKYNLKGDGRLNYRQFCEIINRPFKPNALMVDPVSQTADSTEFLGTKRSLVPLPVENEEYILQLLQRLQQYYKYRGINLRTSCEDFDRHHIGVIQESQFYRSFPHPHDVSDEDVALLVSKYRDIERPGLLNYLNLHHDLMAIGQMEENEDVVFPKEAKPGDYLPAERGADATLQQIFDRIRVACFKNRVRTIEFFRDYDKLRSQVITENQFVCGLSLAIGKEAQLSRSEIQKIVEFYKTEDSRVRYKEFCDMAENAFNIPDLEKKPTLTVVRPPEGALGRNLPDLDEASEQRVREVLSNLSDQVRKRRLMMYQYFKDYDRSKGYSRVITPTQFGRILHFLSLNVAAEDFKILCSKFADPATGDVNYPAFVQTVDREFVNYTQDSTEKQEKKASTPADENGKVAEREYPEVTVENLIARIRHHVLSNSRRVCEYFQDFDPLRSGSITKNQFRRGLSDLGLSALGQHNLSNAEFEVLAAIYQDPRMVDKVIWTQLMKDIDFVGKSDLEKNPSLQVPPSELFIVPKPGTIDWQNASDEHKQMVAEVMNRLQSRANQRRVLVKPVFQDFDRHNNGHVTRSQFRQCLMMLELHCSDDEMQALEAKFCNDTGFNYIAFLKDLQPGEPPKLMYYERLKDINLANQKPKLPEHGNAGDLEGVLTKIKTKVFKKRVRILEFMRDYDKLRSGRISTANFRRALDLCKFELAESELAILEDYFRTPDSDNHVLYLGFSDEIESIFTTKHLEKAPLLEVHQFRPPTEGEQNQLEEGMENLVVTCMLRLSEQVRKNRIQLFPLFEDYDRVHNGTVSRTQFRRVLNELELASLVATEQEWVCLWKKFDVNVGGRDDVNYIAFCDMIYEQAQFEWRKP